MDKQFDNEQSEDSEDSIEHQQTKKSDELEINEDSETKQDQTYNPKKNIIIFSKIQIQDVIKPRQVILVQINKEEEVLKVQRLLLFYLLLVVIVY